MEINKQWRDVVSVLNNFFSREDTVKIRMKMLIGFILLTLPLNLFAAWQATCGVSYETQSGYSSDYSMAVTFLTGRELNKATKTFDYDYFAVYAAIWFREGEVALVRLDHVFFGVGEIFDEEDFIRSFRIITSVEGKDQQGKHWRIKTKKFGMMWM